MTQDQWTAVDHYITDLFVPADPALDAALLATADAGMPLINVAPNQGKLLHILALSIGARSILEIGTLGGYSTIWLARALPAGGRLISLEADPKHAEVARANIARANLADIVEVRLGRALETLSQLAAEGLGPFDLVFIDADKPGYIDYYEAVLPKLADDGVILADNTLAGGNAIAPNDTMSKAIARFNDHVRADDRVECVLLTIRDGITLIRKRRAPA